MGGTHARLSPSNHRWVHCPGSIREEQNYPDSSGEAAIDGTGSHLLLELCLASDVTIKPASYYLMQIIGIGHEDEPTGWLVDSERVKRVQTAVDYVVARSKEIECNGTMYVEQRANIGDYFGRDDWYGTVDIVLVGKDTLEIIDYKDGQMYVSEKNNPQLIAYAAGTLAPYIHDEVTGELDFSKCKFKKVRMTIVQPKTNNPIRFVEMSPVELWEDAKHLAECAKLTDDPDAYLDQGDWCTWCKHGRAGNCTEKTKAATEGITAMSTVPGDTTSLIDLLSSGQVAPGTMDDGQISKILDAAPLIRKMLEQIEDEAMKRIEGGSNVPGYGIGKGRSSKKWIDDEETVFKKLKGMRVKKAECYPEKLISPAQALKLECLTDRQRQNVEKMIESVPGKPKVVKSNVINETPEEMFKEVKPISFM